MTFAEAKQTKKPFGKYRGDTLDKIAETDEGLRHLDWLVGWFAAHPLLFPEFREALRAYLRDPAIEADIRRILEQ